MCRLEVLLMIVCSVVPCIVVILSVRMTESQLDLLNEDKSHKKYIAQGELIVPRLE